MDSDSKSMFWSTITFTATPLSLAWMRAFINWFGWELGWSGRTETRYITTKIEDLAWDSSVKIESKYLSDEMFWMSGWAAKRL